MLIFGKYHPSRGAAHFCLNIGLFSVRGFGHIAPNCSIEIRNPRCFHSRRGTAQVVEQGHVVVLVRDSITNEDSSSFVLSQRISGVQFMVLFEHQSVQLTEMYCSPVSLSFQLDIGSRPGVLLIPAFFVA